MHRQSRWLAMVVLAQLATLGSAAHGQTTQPADASDAAGEPANLRHDGAATAAQADGVVCQTCHVAEHQQFAKSVHASAGVECRSCHGGLAVYNVPPQELEPLQQRAAKVSGTTTTPAGASFQHGDDFRGRPSHRQIPEFCGTCHSDVTVMNPYGLPTDQLAQYKTSGHGKAVFSGKGENAAVCTECHGRHEILSPKDPASSVNARNIPATCGHCHSNPTVMAGTQLSTRIPEQYRRSVHGQGLLELGDTGMPQCATCHGSHSAVPPGFREVGHVCGRCHQQEHQHFLQSPHAKFPNFPMCVGCHTESVDLRDHRIMPVVASAESAEKAYRQALATMPAGDIEKPAFRAAYEAHRKPTIQPFQSFCKRCHTRSREIGHRAFFGELDEMAAKMGDQLYELGQHAELSYASTSHDVNELQHGVLLVGEELLLVEEMKTKLVGVGPLQHTLSVPKVKGLVSELDGLADQTRASLGTKLKRLQWRYQALLPIWAFIAIFVAALWTKYKRLKHAMVKPLPDRT